MDADATGRPLGDCDELDSESFEDSSTGAVLFTHLSGCAHGGCRLGGGLSFPAIKIFEYMELGPGELPLGFVVSLVGGLAFYSVTHWRIEIEKTHSTTEPDGRTSTTAVRTLHSRK